MRADKIKVMLAPFRVYGATSSSVSKAFASAIAPVDVYDAERVGQMLELLGQDPDGELSCVYCARPAAAWDHLESIVRDKQFHPPGHVIGNLVPSCARCNGQKGNRPWREFVAAAVAPERQDLVVERIERIIEVFVATRPAATSLDDVTLGRLNDMRDEIHRIMREADELIEAVRPRTPPRRASCPDGTALPGTFDPLFDEVFDILEVHGLRRPTSRNRPYLTFRAGAFGSFWVWPTSGELRVVCYLGTTHADAGDRATFNHEVFSLLHAQEEEIESRVGEDLVWEPMEGRQACWIGLTRPLVDLHDAGARGSAAAWAADAALRLLAGLEDLARRSAAEVLATRRLVGPGEPALTGK